MHLYGRPGFQGGSRGVFEVEHMGPDNHGLSDGASFQQVLSAEFEKAAPDDRHIAGGVVGEHLTHAVPQPYMRCWIHRFIAAAALVVPS